MGEDMTSRLYTASELASILGVNPQTIYRAGQRGEIASYRVGRSVRFEIPKTETRQRLTKETKCRHDTEGTNT